MKIKPIRTEADYADALKRVEDIFFAKPNTEEFDELEVLSTLIDAYETANYKIDDIDPIQAIKDEMKSRGMKQKDLAPILGSPSRVSEILNKKRKPTSEMIIKLHETLGMPLETLIKAAV